MISLIFSFFLSICITLVVVLGTARLGLFSLQGFLAIFDDTYFESVLTYTNERITAYTYPTGIDPHVVDDVVTREDVERDVTGMVRAAFEGAEYEPDLSEIESRLTANVLTFLVEGNAEVSGKSGEIVTTYVDEIKDIYLDVVRLPALDSIAKVRSTYVGSLTIALAISLALAVVLTIGIRGLHHFLHRSLRFVAYATGGASLMCLVGPLIVYLSKAYEGLILKPHYLYHFGITAITRTLVTVIVCGAVLAAVTFLLTVAIRRMRDAVIHRHSHHRRRSQLTDQA